MAPKDIAGTYLTMLNTFSNLGAMWVSPFAFYMVDKLTLKERVVNPKYGGKDEPQFIEHITLDGFYIVSAVCGILGILGFPMLWAAVSHIQSQPKSAWAIRGPESCSLPAKLMAMKGAKTGKGK